MLTPGLVSISFRKRSLEEIAADCVQTNLRVIEWGGDIHVPHGDFRQAEIAAEITQKNGLTVAAYGSYFRAGEPDHCTPPPSGSGRGNGAPKNVRTANR